MALWPSEEGKAMKQSGRGRQLSGQDERLHVFGVGLIVSSVRIVQGRQQAPVAQHLHQQESTQVSNRARRSLSYFDLR
jgi:hypothetical protein